MIKRIEATNFKKLKNFKANFTNGTNLVLGENGAGKSTIFNLVRFALYGTAAIASSADNIPTWGEKSCKVVLEMDDFKVIRTLSGCKIFTKDDDGEFTVKSAEGNKPCSLWVKEHLGLDHKMFSVFNMSMQGETGALITLGATAINQIVEKFSGVEILDKVIKSLNKEITSTEGALGALEYTDLKPMYTTQAQTKKTLLGLSTELETLTDVTAKHREELDLIFRTITEANKRNEQVREVDSAIKATQKQLDDLGVSIDKAKSELAEVPEVKPVDEMKVRLDAINRKVKDFEQANHFHDKLLERLEDTKKEIQDLVELVDVKATNDEQIARLNTLIEEKQAILEEENETYSILKTKAKEAIKVRNSGVCTSCNRPFDNFDPEKAKHDAQVASEARDAQKEVVDTLTTELSALNKELRGIAVYDFDIQERIEDYTCTLNDIQSSVDEIEAKWGDFDDEEASKTATKLTADIATHEMQAKHRTRLLGAVDDLCKWQKAKTDELSGLKATKQTLGSAVDVDKMTSDYEELKEFNYEQSQQLANLQRNHETVTNQLSNLESDIAFFTEQNERYETAGKTIDQAKRLVKFLRTRRVDYMEGVWHSVLGLASVFVKSTTQGWITEIGRNKNGDFTFTEDGINAPVYSEASGAQKEFIGVALRVGMSGTLQGNNRTLMLDEPTSGMREENADKLASGVLGIEGQKIIITHRQSELLTAANVINL